MTHTTSTTAPTDDGRRRCARGLGITSTASFWRSWRGGLVLILICLAVYVPGQWTLPAIDRDESRFAQASRQMAESDRLADWVVPRVQERARLNKPPVIYWLQAASVRTFASRSSDRTLADAIWMYRLPSAISAVAAVLLLWRWGTTLMHPATAGLAAAGLAVSPVMVWEAHQARADMVLVAVTTAALWTLSSVLRARDGSRNIRDTVGDGRYHKTAPLARILLLWTLVGIGVMVKGPVTPMLVIFAVLALAAWTRSWRPIRSVRPLLGILIVAAVATPWVVLVMREVGVEQYLTLIKDETIGRSVEAKEGHWGPPGYHALLSFVLLGPVALTIGIGIWRGFARSVAPSVEVATHDGSLDVPSERSRVAAGPLWRRLLRARDANGASAILISILVPGWIIFELVTTKLPHYTMPLLGVLALLGVRAALSGWTRNLVHGPRPREWFKFCCSAYAIGMGLAAIILCGASGFALWVAGDKAWGVAAGVLGIALAAWSVTAIERRWRMGDIAAALRAGVAVFAVGSVALMLGGPNLPWIHTSDELAKQIREIDPTATRPVLAVDYHEDSLIFETQGRARRVSAKDALEALRSGGKSPGSSDEEALVVMPWEMAAANRVKVAGRGRVKGFNYSRGEWVDLVIAERNVGDLRSR